MAARDLTLHISSKLGGEWSAPAVAGMLTAPILEYLVSKWSSLDTMVKTRLLMAPLSLKPDALDAIRSALGDVLQAGLTDKDEWVRVMACLVKPYDGRLHLDAVAAEFRLVSKALADLSAGLSKINPAVYRPTEESYLDRSLLHQAGGAPTPGHRHFRVRPRSEAPSQKPISAGQDRSVAGIGTPRRGPIMPRGPSQERLGTGGPTPTSSASASRPQTPMFMPSISLGSKRPSSSTQHSSGTLQRRPVAADIFLPSSSTRGRPAAGSRTELPTARRTMTLDISTVAALNQQAAAEKERKAREEREAKEAAAKKRAAEMEAARTAARAAREAAREAAKQARQHEREKKRKRNDEEKKESAEFNPSGLPEEPPLAASQEKDVPLSIAAQQVLSETVHDSSSAASDECTGSAFKET